MAQVHPQKAHVKPPFPPQQQDAPGEEHKMDPKPDYGEKSYKGFNRLQGRVAIITGGDSGIGRAVAVAYAREGSDIVISYLNEHQDAEETKKVVEAAGRKCELIPGDIQDDNHCKEIIKRTVDKFGKIDILVNNAAFQGKAVENFEDIDHARVVKTFHTNIIAMFDLTRHALPHMKEGGAVINVGSIQAYNPSDCILDYASTKGAIIAFSKGLAQQLIKRGIRVNVVAPGPVWTPLIVASFGTDHVSKFGEHNPMGRPAQPCELAPAFVFLASDEARFVNGEVLGVTGGGLLA
eukprot:Phypoly_transcript_12975.p1 GENE.Phypoly_transcript_12975~~Phypoly_transcript_12975.p1  ORF type:complete len:293 (+),score=49.36 Phypoly_transcript_12975:159-1037(+)